MTHNTFRHIFDPYFTEVVTQKLTAISKTLNDPFLDTAIDQTKKIILHGGKRTRPYLCALMYTCADDKDITPILDKLAALELFHVFGLIHDDIIDHGLKRHGEATLHEFVKQSLSKDERVGDFDHIGEAQALLIGDILFGLVTDLFYTTPPQPETHVLFHSMIRDVLIGQMIDADSTTRRTSDEKSIWRKMELKTARYSVIGPMLIGRSLATDDTRFDSFITEFGLNVGLAYQIQDDLLDYVDPDDSTKSTLLDVQAQQHTLITYYFEALATPEQKESFHTLTQSTSPSHDQILSLLTATGVMKKVTSEIDQLFRAARQAIQTSPLHEEDKQTWSMLVDYLHQRKN